MLSQSINVVRLLSVEHIEKNGKPLLYLVFEYLDTDLKKFIDTYQRGPKPRPLEPSTIQGGILRLRHAWAHRTHGRFLLLSRRSVTSEAGHFDDGPKCMGNIARKAELLCDRLADRENVARKGEGFYDRPVDRGNIVKEAKRLEWTGG
ncbi:cell division control protein 2 homolog C-like [Amborella trichopoda]|uniref:cell division control protein 2 homolog C-like n=1 Tax=Amborella trichopoda TaxID=13333 RepID=UPI0009BF8265|nr:cell division control protein 2 homolog C-like [Amborella trichopoda]|eukprot:XP_020529138.1 cell division control protein 2 homolog C-like [Amborella trichopoda]